MQVVITPVTMFQQNCSLLWCTTTLRGAVVDPGGDTSKVLAAASQAGVTVEKLLITHAHIDHAGATASLARELGVPIEGPHHDDQFWIDQLPEQGRAYGFPPAEIFTPNRWLTQGDTVTVGNLVLNVAHCPGHTPGHVVFFEPTQRIAFVGDVLFQGSVGRTDLPRGDHATLLQSITQRLWPWGDEVTFVPGHGPTSTFGHERRTNPYVADHRLG